MATYELGDMRLLKEQCGKDKIKEIKSQIPDAYKPFGIIDTKTGERLHVGLYRDYSTPRDAMKLFERYVKKVGFIKNSNRCICAFRNKEMVGELNFDVYKEPFNEEDDVNKFPFPQAEIATIAVSEIGRGYGGAILDCFMKACTGAGIRTITTTDIRSNESELLFDRRGFTTISKNRRAKVLNQR